MMRNLTKLSLGFAVVLGLAVPAATTVVPDAPKAQAADAAISIDQFQYNPAELAAKAGTPITITNNDDMPHTVTAEDGSFDVTVPAKGTAQVTAAKAGSFPYTCTLHPGQHNPAKINAS